jgi:putative addiction module component (TIGR02574 family)
MPDLLTELSTRAQALAPEDRARLAEDLLASLAPQVADVEAAWDAELKQRIEQVEQGNVSLVPADQALAQIRRTLGQ